MDYKLVLFSFFLILLSSFIFATDFGGTWTARTGSWSISGQSLSTSSVDAFAQATNPMSTTLTDYNMQWQTTARITNTGQFNMWIARNDILIDGSSFSGTAYGVFCNVGAGCRLLRRNGSVDTVIMPFGGTINANTDYNLLLTRRVDGNWKLFINNAYIGSAFDINSSVDFNTWVVQTENNTGTTYFNNAQYSNTDINFISLTINYPIDEKTLNQLVEKYKIVITGTNYTVYNDLNTSKTITIPKGSNISSIITITDVNGNYFSRTYVKNYSADSDGDTIQPYLLKTTDGSAIKFIVLNEYNNPLQDLFVNIYKTVNNVKTLMSSSKTDATGTALFYLVAGDNYFVEMYFNNSEMFSTTNYTVTSTPVYFYLNLSNLQVFSIDFNQPRVYWNVSQGLIPTSITNLIGTVIDANDVHFIYYQYLNGVGSDINVIASDSSFCDVVNVCVINKTLSSFVFDTNKPFFVDVYAWNDLNLLTKSTYQFVYSPSNNLNQLFYNVRLDFGCSANPLYPCGLTTLISVIIVFGILGFLIFFVNVGSNIIGLSLISVLCLGIFTYFGWFYWVLYIILVLLVILSQAKHFVSGGV